MGIIHIWSEGYWANGDGKNPAHLHASIEAENLRAACDKLAETNSEFKKYYDPERMTFWACRLFDNHADAARSFG